MAMLVDIPLGSGNFIYFALIKKIIKQKLHILPDLYTTQTLNIVGYGVYTHTHTLLEWFQLLLMRSCTK